MIAVKVLLIIGGLAMFLAAFISPELRERANRGKYED